MLKCRLFSASSSISISLFPIQERLQRYMQREHEMRYSECARELHNAVADKLVEQYVIPAKGPKPEQDGYRIPEIVDEVNF